MNLLYNGNVYRVTFAHHNPAKPTDKLPKEPQAEEDKFTGTRCTIQLIVDGEPKAFVRAYAYLGKVFPKWTQDISKPYHKRWDQFSRKMGRMISLRRAAKLMFGKSKPPKIGADEFITAYLTARYDYTREKELGY